ncbi:MAG: acetate kinase [Lachnospiraceae bacterium]|nr:acetate kinase [Lachnospiraceae bacterium]MCI9369162.1 acetate kinase [Lachnospiraceae bacterium]
MKILVLNCGSSSLKYQLIDMENEEVLAKGLCERIGQDGAVLTHKPEGKDKYVKETAMPDHQVAVQLVLDALMDAEHGVITDSKEIGAVGHRVLHAGQKYSQSIVVDEKVKAVIRECFPLGPLHNPANLIGIEACEKALPGTPNVAVFDTAFHQTMPPKAYMYAVPYNWYEDYDIRRYGFHGTSHAFVSARAIEFAGLDPENSKVIVCHLGNGSSISAVLNGKCIDTSMGLTPLEGLPMGTRSGDIDPAIVQFVANKEGKTVDEMLNILNKKSGMLAVSGRSSDFRDLNDGMDNGDERCKLALEIFCYKVAKYIGSYIAALHGVDAIAFTAGVGENDNVVRKMVMEYFDYMGIKLDEEENNKRGDDRYISTSDSSVKVLVIPTNEELRIARETQELV